MSKFFSSRVARELLAQRATDDTIGFAQWRISNEDPTHPKWVGEKKWMH